MGWGCSHTKGTTRTQCLLVAVGVSNVVVFDVILSGVSHIPVCNQVI